MFEFYLFINKEGAPAVRKRVSSLLRPQAMDCVGITLPLHLHIVPMVKHKNYKATGRQTKSGQKAVISYWKQNDIGEDSCVWDWYGEKC